MTNNSPVYWTANGLSLHTKAWSVKSFGGRRFFGPSKKGSNLDLPFNRGQVYLPKSRNAQLYDINMWVFPLNQDGTRSSVMSREEMAHNNFRTILDSVDVEGQFDLVKRWYTGPGTLASATARAEFVDGSGPDTDDGRGFYWNLQFLLADPYFYVPVSPFSVTGSISAVGEAPSDHVTITFTAGTDPRLTFHDGNYIQYTGVVGSGVSIVVDCKKGTAKNTGTNQYVNGLISRNPAFAEWPRIFKGVNNLVLSGTSAAATLQYDAAYR